MGTRLKASDVERKKELVGMAVEYCGSQRELMRKMNAFERLDGRTTSPTEICRWLHEDRMVGEWDALWIHLATDGHVRYEWFHNGLRETVAKANRYRIRKIAA